MKSGLDFLEANIFKGGISHSITRESIELPPIFSLFIKNFRWSQTAISAEGLFYLPFLKGGEIYFDGWNYQEIFSKPIVFDEDYMEQRGMIPVATSNKGIYLGTKGADIDNIFSTENSLEDSFVQIADNIFEFIRGLTDNISMASTSEKEFTKYMTDLGYEDEELREEVLTWIAWKEKQK